MLKFTLNNGGGNDTPDSGTLPTGGHVSKLRANWTVHEDGALAQRLQSEEINQHYHGNRQRNHQIREDVPRARQEQTIEVEQACRLAEERRRALHELESQDAEIAKHEQCRQDSDLARQIQHSNNHHQRFYQNSSTSGTPPLPIMADGDVPGMMEAAEDLPRQIVYNDEQYQVKLARPALIRDEPVYANNKPEHYAVSAKYPGGAIAKVPAASPRRRAFLNSSSETEENVVSLAGLSQKDVVLSRRAEEQLEQEKLDQEIARRLQQQIDIGAETEDDKLAREAQDLEYAKMLHAKDKAKIKRAKERSKQKKLLQQQQEQLPDGAVAGPRADSRTSRNSRNGHTPQHSFDEAAEPRLESRRSQRCNNDPNRSFTEEANDDDESVISAPTIELPARRPYMNTGAIDSHKGAFACTDDVNNEADESELSEPQYANVGPNKYFNEPQTSHVRQTSNDGLPVPPYMPMQQSMSKRSTSLEKKIKRKKEKEGCKQQ